MGSTQIVVSLTIGEENRFGNNDKWEVALYEGAIPGEEIDRRFTNWILAKDGSAIVTLPEDAREEFNIPMGKEKDTYVRIRSVEGYPNFDMVTKPFTLLENVTVVIPVVVNTNYLKVRKT